MAAGGQIAEFFGTLGFKIESKDIKRFDRTLKLLEKRAQKFTEGSLSNMKVRITGFQFSPDFNTKLYKSVKKKMSILNNKKGLSPEIKVGKFDVDRNELLREMREAVRYVENNIRVRVRPDVQRPPMGSERAYRGMQGYRGDRFGQGLGVGAASGALGRGFIPGLGLAFGISQINQINQDLMGQQYAAQAIFGSQDQGQQGLDWLRRFSQEVGIDYRQQGQPYLRMMASATNAGMNVGETQSLFAGVSRYGRTMGLGTEDMKGSLRAIEQMLNKQQVYAEELKTQLAEKMPGVISAMAEAVTGNSEGTAELFKLMEEGNVSATEYLPKFAAILQERAMEGGAYEKAIRASTAEQQRFNNAFNDMVRVFSEAGFEEGQASIFRTMTTFLRESIGLIRGFGEAWVYVEAVIRVPLGLIRDFSVGLETFSDYTGMAKGELLGLGTVLTGLLLPFTRMFTIISIGLAVLEDFTGFLSGRDSLLGTLLGEDSEALRQQLISLFSNIAELTTTIFDRLRDIFSLISSDSDSGWLQTVKSTLEEINRAIQAANMLLGRTPDGSPQGSEEERSSAWSTAGQFLYDRTLFGFIDNNFGEGKSFEPFKENLKNLFSPSILMPWLSEETPEARASQMSQMMPSGAGVMQNTTNNTPQYNFSGGITINGVQSPEDLAEALSSEITGIFGQEQKKWNGGAE